MTINKATGYRLQATGKDRRAVFAVARSLKPQAIRQRGISLIAALFLIVVVSALGAFAVRIGASQQQTVNSALLAARALAAAQAGIVWAGYQAVGDPLNPKCAASTTLTLPATTLSGVNVVVTCQATPHEGGAITIFNVTATAQVGTYGTPDYTARKISATFSSAS